MKIRISAQALLETFRYHVSAKDDVVKADLGKSVREYLLSIFPENPVKIPDSSIGGIIFSNLEQNNKSNLGSAIAEFKNSLDDINLPVGGPVMVALGAIYRAAKEFKSTAKAPENTKPGTKKPSEPTPESEEAEADPDLESAFKAKYPGKKKDIKTTESEAEREGNALLSILQNSYLGEIPTKSAFAIGKELIDIASDQFRYENDPELRHQKALDSLHDLFTYYLESNYDFRKPTKDGKPGAEDINTAIKFVRSHLRKRAMTQSMREKEFEWDSPEAEYANLLYWKNEIAKQPDTEKVKGAKRKFTEKQQGRMNVLERQLKAKNVDPKSIEPKKGGPKAKYVQQSIDKIFGTRPEGGGAPEGGEANIPEVVDTEIEERKILEKTVDKHIPAIRAKLNEDEKVIFDTIFYDEVGDWVSNISENMNFKQSCEERAKKDNHPNPEKFLDKSFRLGEKRDKVTDKINAYISGLSVVEKMELREAWLSSRKVDPSAKIEKAKSSWMEERRKQERTNQTQIKYLELLEKVTEGIATPEEVEEFEKLSAEVGSNVKYKDPSKIKQSIERFSKKIPLENEYAKLLHIDTIRDMTYSEEQRFEEIPGLLKELDVKQDTINRIPPMPPEKPTIVEYISWLKYLEERKMFKNGEALDKLLDDLWDDCLQQFDAKIVSSISPTKPNAQQLKLLEEKAERYTSEIQQVEPSGESKAEEENSKAPEVKTEVVSPAKTDSYEKIKSLMDQFKKLRQINSYNSMIDNFEDMAKGGTGKQNLRSKTPYNQLDDSDYKALLEEYKKMPVKTSSSLWSMINGISNRISHIYS
jgi:hypothetical protein